MSRRFQRSITTAVPTVQKAKSPTILHEMVKLRKTPVRIIQVHQGLVNLLLERNLGQLGVQEGRGRSSSRVAELVEADVGVEGDGHEEYERGVEEDEARLGDMSVVWKRKEVSSSPKRPFRLSVDSPMSTKAAEKTPTILGYPDSLMMPYTTGGTSEPRIAGRTRRPT